jgi:polysaccharide pyruvyl transferase WcaK-like protein
VKLLYLADNSDLMNWGCQATSRSLRELIGQQNEIVGTVGGSMIEATYPVSDVVSDRYWGPFSRTFNRSLVRRSGVLNLIGKRNALSHDLGANIATLKRARAYDPRIRAMFEALEAADGIVVNGEGDLIFQTPVRDRLLFTLTVCELGLRAGKPLYYLNAMVSACPTSGVNRETLALAAGVLARASSFTVRDPVSLAFVQAEMPGVSATMFPDAVFSWAGRTTDLADAFARTGAPMPAILKSPYLVLAGGSRAAHNKPLATERYVSLVDALSRLGLPILLAPGCDGDLFLKTVSKLTGAPMLPLETPIEAVAATLANARVMVSGRWHPSIMASLGGVPTVFMGSNSHKTLTIQTMLEQAEPVEFHPTPDDDQIAAIVERTRGLLALGEAERTRILEVTRRLGFEARKSVATIVPPPAKAAAA